MVALQTSFEDFIKIGNPKQWVKTRQKTYSFSCRMRLIMIYHTIAHMSSVFNPHGLSQSWSPSSAVAFLLEEQLSIHGFIQSPIQVSSTSIE